jgi:O-antigen/teichoic acid export membrane protein
LASPVERGDSNTAVDEAYDQEGNADGADHRARCAQELSDLQLRLINEGSSEDGATRGDAEILAKGASVSLTGTIAARALAMVTQVLMARFLGAADFGLYAIGWTLIRVLESVNTLGLGTAVIYYGADYHRSDPSRFKGVLRQSITLASLTGFTIGTILFLLAPVLAEYLFRKPDAAPVIRAFAPAFPLYAIAFVGDGMTRLSKRMQYSAYSNIGAMAFSLIVFCILYMLGWGLLAAVIATVSGIGVGALMSMYFIRGLFPAVFAKEIPSEWPGRELLSFSIPVALGGLAVSLLAFIDRLFVASYCSSTETGIYQAAAQLPIMLAIIFGAFDNIFSPMVADLHARRESRRLAELYRVCAKWRVYVSVPFLMIMLFAPAELIQTVYGKAYAEGALPLAILSIGQLSGVVAGNSQTMLTLTGRQRIVVVITLATLLLDVGLNFALVPRYGLVGAATAAALSAMVLNVSTASAVLWHAPVSPFDLRYAKSLGAALFTCVVLYLLGHLQVGPPPVKLFLVGGLGVATFAGFLIAFGLDAEDREVLNMIRTRLMRLQPVSLH